MPRTTHKYRCHKASGRAFVHIGGKRHYLGPYGSESSLKEYRRILDRLDAGQPPAATQEVEESDDLTVSELLERYWKFAEQHYRKNGQLSSEHACLVQALRFLRIHAGNVIVTEFGPLALKQIRDAMIKAKRCRPLINRDIGRIRRIFRWAAEEEYVPIAVYESLRAVQGLQRGRCEAHDPEPIGPAPIADVKAVLPYLSRQLQAMIMLQLHSGCRPGEACIIRPIDVTRTTQGAWVYRPLSHKTEHRNRERRIFLGPQAQAVLKPWLDRDPESFCFSPREARDEFDQAKRAGRKSPRTPSQEARKRKKAPQRWAKDRYSKDSYCRAVARACLRRLLDELKAEGKEGEAAEKWIEKNGLRGSWAPNQLRHTAATRIRELYGIEAASTVLGHADVRVTEIYAERDFRQAAEIMSKIG
jgi:integrase